MLSIEIKPEDLDKIVKDAVCKSLVGQAFETAIEKVFSGYDNPIEKELKNIAGNIAREVISEKYSEVIKEMIISHLESKVKEETLQRTVNSVTDKLAKGIDEYY